MSPAATRIILLAGDYTGAAGGRGGHNSKGLHGKIPAPQPSPTRALDKTPHDSFSEARRKLLKQKEVPPNLATSYLSYNFLTDGSTNQLLSAVYSTVSKLTG